VKFLTLSSLVAALIGLCLWGCGAPPYTFPAWILSSVAYLLIWFSLVGLVCSRGWNSAVNAGVLLGLWTALTVLGPALLNLTLSREVVKNGASITIRARQVVNDGWDTDKQITAEIAEQVDPRYRSAPVVQEEFSWSWYFAMHDAGDAAVEEMANNYFLALEERYNRSLSWSLLFPPVRLQLLLDEFAATDLRSHLDYYRFVKQSRQDLRDQFLPRVFAEETLTKKELLQLHEEIPIQIFEPSRERLWSRGLLEIVGLSLLLLSLSLLSLGRVERRLKG
jgi:ABC-2 type transport system permease protein